MKKSKIEFATELFALKLLFQEATLLLENVLEVQKSKQAEDD